MILSDLPKEVQDKLREERKGLKDKWQHIGKSHVTFVNSDGTFYLSAFHMNGTICSKYPFWSVKFGMILWCFDESDKQYKWVKSSKKSIKVANGIEIPSRVDRKIEVIELAKRIGIVDIE